MVYPSKQNELYETLNRLFLEKYYPGAKLPPERELAHQLGVARRTLRFTLDRLEEEERIIRKVQGTFLTAAGDGVPEAGNAENPVSILLPCPDYIDAANSSSVYVHTQLIRGAMRVAAEHGTHVVTIPVSDTNDFDNIKWSQLRHLHRDSMVLFAGEWFQRIFPLLLERKCRIGYLSFGSSESDTPKKPFFDGIPEISGIYGQWLPTETQIEQAIRRFVECGAEKIQYFGSSGACLSQHHIKEAFFQTLQKFSLPADSGSFMVFDAQKLSLKERLQLLAERYREYRFDALFLELNPYPEPESDFDFYEETGLPFSVKLITQTVRLLSQQKLVEHAEICHLPVYRTAMEMTRFLLSGRQEKHYTAIPYLLQPAEEFIAETNYKP